ncbi:MAG: radical SAM protein [Candidatus Lernaella stagnicola]|nr:radical SAM protein [Candidatus Lernaella stagnicola]
MVPLVTLVNPPRLRQVTKRPSYTAEPHLGLAYIAAFLRRAGFDVRFIDGDVEELSAVETATRALVGDPLYIGFTAPTALVKSAAKVAEEVKRRSPHTPLVLGGYHATVLPEDSLREFSAFDAVAIGEGEFTAVELAEQLRDGGGLAGVDGMAWREDGEIRRGEPRAVCMDLDSFPLPAWDLFPLQAYQAHYSTDRSIIELPVNTGRGCPGRCKFCARVSGRRVRRRSAASILAEVHENVRRYGARAIVFMDESFAHERLLVHEVCRGLIDTGLHRRIYWLCQTRIDSVDRETLRLMAKSGCRHISFGVESGSEEILTSVHKGIGKDIIRRAVSEAQAAHILVDNFFIIGLPGETRETIRETIRFAVELNSDFANFFLLVPYPGTEVYTMAERGEGGLRLLTKDWDLYGIQMGRALELADIPRSKLEQLQFWAYLRFYLRPSRLPNMLRMVNLKVLPVYLWNLFGGWLRGSKNNDELAP